MVNFITDSYEDTESDTEIEEIEWITDKINKINKTTQYLCNSLSIDTNTYSEFKI